MIVDAARFLDHPGEIALAAATVVALAAVVAGLPPLLRPAEAEGGRGRVTPALVMLTGGAALTLTAHPAFELRCRPTRRPRGAGGRLAGPSPWGAAEASWGGG